MKELTLLGGATPETITAEELETFPTPEGCGAVTFETDEHTSLCPKTGQPDFYELIISYFPDKKCLESKALKLYLRSFRGKGNFVEQMVCKICDDLSKVLEPNVLRVVAKMSPRGGISIEAEKVFSKYDDIS